MLRFGTDGVRGPANSVLTVEYCVALGRAIARTFRCSVVIVGRDSRLSGSMLESALCAGLASEGVNVECCGVVPTPVVATLSRQRSCVAVMISASHNPFGDNGVKVFAPGGTKLSDAEQANIESHVESILAGAVEFAVLPVGTQVGRIDPIADPLGSYLATISAALGQRRLDGLSVVLDCANGASVISAPAAFEAAGAAVKAVAIATDGVSINDGWGSTHPEGLARMVTESAANLGFAFDGDADRVVAVDERGQIVDGDQIIAMLAVHWKQRGTLRNSGVAVTIMTNLGFHHAMDEHGISVVQTAVGDRHVAEAIELHQLSLGGEQSGHVICADIATTGDGVLTALLVAEVVAETGRPLSELVGVMRRLPQSLVNASISAPMPDAARQIAAPIEAAQHELGDTGRVVVRPSGTEPVVRVMVEASTLETAVAIAERLAAEVVEVDRQRQG